MVDVKCYAIIGVKTSVFSISNNNTAETVGDLKKVMKQLQPVPIDCDAKDLQLFLVQKDNGRVESYDMKGKSSTLLKALAHAKEELQEEELLAELGTGKIHVLMAVPREIITGNVRKREWFPHDFVSAPPKKLKGGEDAHTVDDHALRHIQMPQLPPMAHPRQNYSPIVERESYKVIFSDLVDKVKDCFERKTDAKMVVTGNPGAGLSRFYLYFAFQLLRRHDGKGQERPPFELVLNSVDSFHKYCAKDDTFIELDKAEVRDLSKQRSVLRLIEGNSSRLLGWKGVSILFASHSHKGLRRYAKCNSFTYYVPMWSLRELQDYNTALPDMLKLPDDILVTRFGKFGGNPGVIFTETQPENDAQLNRAIANFDALKVVSFAECNAPVRDEDLSSCVLQMVPSDSTFRANYHLAFLSDYIAEKVALQVNDESLEKVAKFALSPTPNGVEFQGNSELIRGKMFQTLCHRWFGLTMVRTLNLRPLSSEAKPWGCYVEEMPTVRFSSLEEVPVLKEWTYYWPKPNTLEALDAFVLVADDLFGFRMTRDLESGVEAAPLSNFLIWLESVGLSKDQFNLVFVVPSHMEKEFKMQTIRTETGLTSEMQGPPATIKQLVSGLDLCKKTTDED